MLDADVEVDRRDFTVRAAVCVAPGERLALFGPSGAGKTTLLEAIAGLVAPRRGRIVLGGRVLTSTELGQAVPPWQRRVGLLRQNPGLFPHLSVRANLSYGRRATGPDPEHTELTELTELAALLGVGDLLAVMPARLSGGQAHRVALGRLLLAHCDTLLLDEPFTGLDASLRRALTDLVVSLVIARDVPAVLVTHELADAQAFADRLAILDRGELLQVGAPDEVVLRPASRRVAELVGYLGFVPVQCEPSRGEPSRGEPARGEPAGGGPAGPTGGGPTGPTGDGPASPTGGGPTGPTSPARTVTVGIHPERTLAGAHPGRGVVLTGAVTASRPAGAGWEADVRVAETVITCRLPDRPPSGGGFVVTVLDPPYFGPDGAALRPCRPEPCRPEQVRG